ncbi:hypothetical protein TWF481_006389 [Arthrobotrys musiformis]|uniref:F-box domain-containing protein n=1 Tax=Arthrobotrys musiformis TaxID=47236 RepID=A0AAV9WIK9_9PEZI
MDSLTKEPRWTRQISRGARVLRRLLNLKIPTISQYLRALKQKRKNARRVRKYLTNGRDASPTPSVETRATLFRRPHIAELIRPRKQDCYFLRLPVELQRQILGYCHRGRLGRIAKTCRQFYDICLYHHLYDANICSSANGLVLTKLAERPNFRRAVRNLRLGVYPPEGWRNCSEEEEEESDLEDSDSWGDADSAIFYDDLDPSYNSPEMMTALSNRHFEGVQTAEIKYPVSQLKSFIEIINALADNTPSKFDKLSIQLEDEAESVEVRLTVDETDFIRYPAGISHLKSRITSAMGTFDYFPMFRPSANTLNIVDINCCLWNSRCGPSEAVVCPLVKILRVTRDIASSPDIARSMSQVFPNVEELALKPVERGGRNSDDSNITKSRAWYSQWGTLKHVKKVRIEFHELNDWAKWEQARCGLNDILPGPLPITAKWSRIFISQWFEVGMRGLEAVHIRSGLAGEIYDIFGRYRADSSWEWQSAYMPMSSRLGFYRYCFTGNG